MRRGLRIRVHTHTHSQLKPKLLLERNFKFVFPKRTACIRSSTTAFVQSINQSRNEPSLVTCALATKNFALMKNLCRHLSTMQRGATIVVRLPPGEDSSAAEKSDRSPRPTDISNTRYRRYRCYDRYWHALSLITILHTYTPTLYPTHLLRPATITIICNSHPHRLHPHVVSLFWQFAPLSSHDCDESLQLVVSVGCGGAGARARRSIGWGADHVRGTCP